jgi:hypothetical protein
MKNSPTTWSATDTTDFEAFHTHHTFIRPQSVKKCRLLPRRQIQQSLKTALRFAVSHKNAKNH